MSGTIFDYDDGEFIYQTSGNMGIGSNGDLYMRTGGNTAMNMSTGELHIVSGWDDEDD